MIICGRIQSFGSVQRVLVDGTWCHSTKGTQWGHHRYPPPHTLERLGTPLLRLLCWAASPSVAKTRTRPLCAPRAGRLSVLRALFSPWTRAAPRDYSTSVSLPPSHWVSNPVSTMSPLRVSPFGESENHPVPCGVTLSPVSVLKCEWPWVMK